MNTIAELTEDQKRLWRAIRQFTNAAIDESWRGGIDPDDWSRIDKRYVDTRSTLLNLIAKYEVTS